MQRNRLRLALLSGLLGMALIACGGGGSASVGSGTTVAPLTAVRPGTETGTEQAIGIPYSASIVALPNSGIHDERIAAAKDAASWNALWAQFAGTTSQAPFQPDFSRNMVVAVFLGSRSPCDKIAVDAVKQKAGPARIEIDYTITPPPADTACIASLSVPAIFVVLPQSDLPVQAVQPAARPADEPAVRSGWGRGFVLCQQDCSAAVEITRAGAAFHSYAASGVQPAQRGTWGTVSADEWKTLAESVASLPDVVIGCPGCADQPAEWLEVEVNGAKKRVSIDCAAELPAAPAFRQTVHAIRSRLAASLGITDVCVPDAIPFDTIPNGVFTSSIADQRFLAVRDAASWIALWAEHTGGRSTVPAIDFTQRMVLAVFLGRASIPCGSMHVASVNRRSNPDRIEVGYRVVDPGDVVCIAANLNQAAFVSVPASPLPVTFVKLP
ncbi:hypothetical protein E4K72_19390 [Oxalobacteraceae bacterium OM1]|nr:hypothetical protein E4K72_19390 [Oxalobacteraceae bacterium OM1]